MFRLFKAIKDKYWKSEFLKNALTLVSGTTIAQGISILTAPVLYRIYEREEYGTLGLYMAITGVIGTFSTLQYHQVILIEKEQDNALAALWLSRSINIVLSLLTLLLIIPTAGLYGKWFNNPAISAWLFLVPLSIFFGGQSAILGEWANRAKAYRLLTINAILTALLVPSLSIPLGIWIDGPTGLFIGLLASQILPTIWLGLSLTKRTGLQIKSFHWQTIKSLARKYQDLPKFSLPSDFINRFTNQLPVFMLSTFAGAGVVGVYNLTVRMLGLPVQLIGNAVAAVFKQRATQEYHEVGHCRNIFLKTLQSLVLISIIPFLILILLGPEIFAFIFGEKWREAGVFAQILGFLFLFRFFASPLSFLFILRQKLKEDFLWHIWMLTSNLIVFYVGFTLFDSYYPPLILFSINYIIIYSIYLFRSYKFSLAN